MVVSFEYMVCMVWFCVWVKEDMSVRGSIKCSCKRDRVKDGYKCLVAFIKAQQRGRLFIWQILTLKRFHSNPCI